MADQHLPYQHVAVLALLRQKFNNFTTKLDGIGPRIDRRQARTTVARW